MRFFALAFLLVVSSAVAGDYSTNFVPIVDKTPWITSTNWEYAESPGTYYWNGLRTGIVMGFFCMIVGAGVRYWVSKED